MAKKRKQKVKSEDRHLVHDDFEGSRYFIMNPSGAIHEVDKELAALRLKQSQGYRVPSKEQIKAYLSKGMQLSDAPIGERYDPQPEDANMDGILDELAEEAVGAQEDQEDVTPVAPSIKLEPDDDPPDDDEGED
jgi:hypothetical protein